MVNSYWFLPNETGWKDILKKEINSETMAWGECVRVGMGMIGMLSPTEPALGMPGGEGWHDHTNTYEHDRFLFLALYSATSPVPVHG